MPKEIRLNDKIWFGKYKGKTVKVILNGDKQFLDNLVERGKIIYGKNIIDYLDGDPKKGKLNSSGAWWDEPLVPPRRVNEPPIYVFNGTQNIQTPNRITYTIRVDGLTTENAE